MLCPICNGFEQIAAACPSCSAVMNDYGRTDDFTAPYAPYQPFSDPGAEATNNRGTMASDLRSELSCRHVIYCPNCAKTYEAAVTKWL
ncbi:hypothetical protein ACFPYJ_25590 [Paenibacillus solisilvae]|uniref:DZANK-type domain-containing protein n=1 Tax=Paenibacillus solisilvae TaxID=2486751 RepID=A0ABW0W4Q1_9BACL